MEKTLVLIKPEIIEKKLAGRVISVYEENMLKIETMKIMIANKQSLENHYYEHKDKPFYENLLEYMSRGEIIAMVLAGENAIEKVRIINGSTDPKEAEEGTIRKLFGTNKSENAVHASATLEDAEREIKIWFK